MRAQAKSNGGIVKRVLDDSAGAVLAVDIGSTRRKPRGKVLASSSMSEGELRAINDRFATLFSRLKRLGVPYEGHEQDVARMRREIERLQGQR